MRISRVAGSTSAKKAQHEVTPDLLDDYHRALGRLEGMQSSNGLSADSKSQLAVDIVSQRKLNDAIVALGTAKTYFDAVSGIVAELDGKPGVNIEGIRGGELKAMADKVSQAIANVDRLVKDAHAVIEKRFSIGRQT
jgi:hypothetical protein